MKKEIKIVVDTLKEIREKNNLTEDELTYLTKAPHILLAGRFDHAEEVLSDYIFVYPLTCLIEKSIDELISRVPNIKRKTFHAKIYSLIKMHSDIKKTDNETNLTELKNKLKRKEYREMFELYIEIKNIRNDISHLRFDKLYYKKFPLSEVSTRASILIDIFESDKEWDFFRLEILKNGRLPPQKQ